MEELNLEVMRNPVGIFKEQLDKQEIVSDSSIREAMITKSKVISNVKLTEFAYAILALLLVQILYFTHLTSSEFVVATRLLIVLIMVSTYYLHKPVDKLNFMKDDLTTVAHVMTEFKKQYNRGLFYGILICILWATWFCIEIWKHEHTFSLIALLGGIIGGISSYKEDRKAMNAAQGIIDEIEKNE